jgi:hypothetical protein
VGLVGVTAQAIYLGGRDVAAVREENVGLRYGDANPRDISIAFAEGKQFILLRMFARFLVRIVAVKADLFSRKPGIAARSSVGVAIDACQGGFPNVHGVVEGDGLRYRRAAPHDAIHDGDTAC